MTKEQTIKIIENAFCHLIYDKNIKVNNIEVLIHFPTIGIALLDESPELDNDAIKDFNELLLMKEINAKPVYLDYDNNNFDVGYVINEILMEAEFVPSIDLESEEQ